MGAVNGSVGESGGTVTFSHDGSETMAASFTYTVQDSDGAVSNTATVSLTVNPVNDAPVAADDAATVPINGSKLIAVLANDSDADDGIDVTSVTIVATPGFGSAVAQASGEVLYTPNPAYNGPDSFTYTVDDASGNPSNEATVMVTVTDAASSACAPRGNRAVVDRTLSIDTSVRFTGPITSYGASGLPASLGIDTMTGVIGGVPVAGDVAGSPYTVMVTAQDGGAGQSLSFRLTVDAEDEVVFFADMESDCIVPGPL